MKKELEVQKPSQLVEKWPGQFDFFSWMEYVTAVPQVLFVVTKNKQNSLPNACLQALSTFTGKGK